MLKLVDVAYGGENGFNQAIELAAEVLQNVKFIQEKKLIGEFELILMIVLDTNHGLGWDTYEWN